MSGAGGLPLDGVLTLAGAVIGWAGKTRRHRKRDRYHELARRIATNERAIRRLWRDVGSLNESTVRLAVALWEQRQKDS